MYTPQSYVTSLGIWDNIKSYPTVLPATTYPSQVNARHSTPKVLRPYIGVPLFGSLLTLSRPSGLYRSRTTLRCDFKCSEIKSAANASDRPRGFALIPHGRRSVPGHPCLPLFPTGGFVPGNHSWCVLVLYWGFHVRTPSQDCLPLFLTGVRAIPCFLRAWPITCRRPGDISTQWKVVNYGPLESKPTNRLQKTVLSD